MASQDIDDIDEPRVQRAEFLHTGADAAVKGGAFRRREVAGEPADILRSDATTWGHAQGVIGRDSPFQSFQAVEIFAEPAGLRQPFGKQSVDEAEKEVDIAAGANEEMFVRDLRGFGAARVYRHHAPSSCSQRPRLAAEIGHGPEAAIGGHGVGAENNEQIRSGNVRNGNAHPVAEHFAHRAMLGHLVDGRGGKDIGRAE